ncbi:MBL fold metallo-hydrolase [Fictibacillus phosphorivorans]|uniref:MBL fold metallo-hydrolase n=1 Tax=Fictibacillus phosphorivorans TaxID=1221500 RepID=UPI00203A4E2F|nr:MBL fold metallo-hydrolase [Fictibacillus phosphorivorans]MCM3719157.1 MBL fold metallo-hydrolase [Fictibacillus phosphorivorans]MCM3776779.1 MBL fold metallo-hydrolase [Fictibacillus phosphorivorans]
MEFIEIKDGCYYFKSAVNIGYILSGDRSMGMLIDAGLEASAAKKALKTLQEERLPVTHLFITHAHADHFGGAQYVQKNVDVHTIAPALEEAIMRYPTLEPMYLFHGNVPLKEMRNKFLEAPPISIDEICEPGIWKKDSFEVTFMAFPGHSYNQFGVLYKNILYAADSFLGKEVLEKHKIPFIVDSASNFSTLQDLLKAEVSGMLPGHGSFLERYEDTIKANIEVHQRVLSQVNNFLIASGDRGLSLEDLISKMLLKHEIEPANLGSYSLFRTAVTSYLIQLIEERKAVYTIKEGRPMVFSGQSSA